ncbi:NAD-dependent epimerase/dehydratase family protein [Magnetospirillum sp. SS-4]|uniref:NAD-dependent epimerase/dehydratase family protein n=1 Tax=Magnetospirillum sp. SS-4 TaxID=2681465 RepID=UPI0013813B10|nr:NAD-dependent epimerase/dehydratase family protein [Magnetospirillum sp. SS-4]CAA7614486.1 Dehydratase-like protein [Magnetospirillum sp. SS-4]
MSSPVSLVTGAAGFLGSHLVEGLLAKGHHVRALDLPGANFARGLAAVRSHANLEEVERNLMDIPAEDTFFAGIDYAFHCAGNPNHMQSMKTPEPFLEANVGTMIRVLEAARHHGYKKVINPSSAAVYGVATPPTGEDHPINPDNPYALSKWLGEEVCQHWSWFFKVPTLSFRVFNGYGPRGGSGPIAFFIRRSRAGQPLTVTGDGMQTRDFTYISDVINAFILGAESDRSGEAYNVATGRQHTLLELCQLIGGEIQFIDPRPEPPAILGKVDKIKAHLGWEPKVSLAEGVKMMMAQDDI